MAWEANQILETKFIYHVNDQTLMQVLHFIPATPGTGVPLDELLAAFAALMTDSGGGSLLESMANLWGTNVECDQVTVQPVFPTRYAVRSEVSAQTGLGPSQCEIQNVSITWTKRGRLGNRSNVGSFHLGGIATAAFNDGGLAPGVLGAVGAMSNALLASRTDVANGVTYVPAILNKEPIPDSDPVRYRIKGATQVVSVTENDAARVMYRRTKGIGI